MPAQRGFVVEAGYVEGVQHCVIAAGAGGPVNCISLDGGASKVWGLR
jgi:hypothetical protein